MALDNHPADSIVAVDGDVYTADDLHNACVAT